MFVHEICDIAGIDKGKIKSVKGQGLKKDKKTRPVKIVMDSEDAKQVFQKAFGKHKPKNLDRKVFCRNDLTPLEIKEDRRL